MRTILVVDPDKPTVDYLRSKLGATNLNIWSAFGGDAALEILRNRLFDLVISALEMPPPHGLMMVRRMRDSGNHTPVILLSKWLHDPAIVSREVQSLERCTHLDKPIFMNRLYRAIEATLQMKIHWTEQRKVPRWPLRLDLNTTLRGFRDVRIPVRAQTIDISSEGLCFERTMCDVCTGYEPGGVHPDCILFKHAMKNEAARTLELDLIVSKHERLRLKAKVAHTFIEEGTNREFIGVEFVELTEADRERLRYLLKTNLRG